MGLTDLLAPFALPGRRVGDEGGFGRAGIPDGYARNFY